MLVYRPHRPDEVDDAIRLISDVYREVLGREVNKFVRDEIHRILDEFEEDNDLFLVAEHEDEMVGTVLIEHSNPEADCCNMQFLVVRRDHRGHGHGRELVGRGLEFAKGAGYKTVELNAIPDFDYAIAMYESLGFQHIDTYLWQGSEVLTFDKFL